MSNDSSSAIAPPSNTEHRIRISNDGLIAQAAPLMHLPWLKHGCTTRAFSPPDANRAHELQHLRRYLCLPENTPILHAEQKHTTHVAVYKPSDLSHITHDRRHVYRQTDGIVSTCPGVMIAILTADCAPVFLVDTRTRSVGLVHAGWKGTLGRIAQRAVLAMTENGSRAEDLLAWIGPMIGGCCYEVGSDMIDQFSAEFTDAEKAGIRFRNGRLLDLVALNAFQLRQAGIAAPRVYQSGACTLHEKSTFYSYRGDAGTTGRIISAIYAQPDSAT